MVEVAGLDDPNTGDTDSSPPSHAWIATWTISCTVSFGGVISSDFEVGHDGSPPVGTSE